LVKRGAPPSHNHDQFQSAHIGVIKGQLADMVDHFSFLRSSTEPHPHHDCDKPDKPGRRHLREEPVYRIKLKRFSA
jgi:hypothetical protein